MNDLLTFIKQGFLGMKLSMPKYRFSGQRLGELVEQRWGLKMFVQKLDDVTPDDMNPSWQTVRNWIERKHVPSSDWLPYICALLGVVNPLEDLYEPVQDDQERAA